MAELRDVSAPWTPRQSRGQLQAIAWLRWRILSNSLRRKGGAGELVGRVLAYTALAGLLIVPIVGVGAGAFFFTHNGDLARVTWLLWATFLLSQLLNLNIGQPGTNFSPNELIRFPLTLRRFILVRLSFGLLTPANFLSVCMSASVALGVTLARHQLLPYAAMGLLIFAAGNVLFSRMVFAWVDRWLSTRRAREIFTALIFTGSLGFQYANLHFNPAYGGHRHRHAAQANLADTAPARFYRRAHPFLLWLPPELTGASLTAATQGQSALFLRDTTACAVYGLVFLTLFSARMRTEFLGENLSDAAHGGSASSPLRRPFPTLHNPSTEQANAAIARQPAANPAATTQAILRKEFLYTRRNIGVFYSLIAPLVMVLLFAGRMTTRSNAAWVLPSALAYTLLGVMPLSYNSFGFEAAGAQFYFFAPVRVRDIMLAKNLIGFGLAALEIFAVVTVTTWLAGPPTFMVLVSALLWTAATLLVCTTFGNRRSLSAPKRISLTRSAGKQASPLSALLSIGVLLAFATVGAVTLFLAHHWTLPWLPLAFFSALFTGALALYRSGLRRLDAYALGHREQLFAELSKP